MVFRSLEGPAGADGARGEPGPVGRQISRPAGPAGYLEPEVSGTVGPNGSAGQPVRRPASPADLVSARDKRRRPAGPAGPEGPIGQVGPEVPGVRWAQRCRRPLGVESPVTLDGEVQVGLIDLVCEVRRQ